MGKHKATGIQIELLELDGNTARVKICQKSIFNGYILNQKQLVDIVKSVFEPTTLQTKVIPVVYSLQVNHIDLDWITSKMQEFGIKRKDLIKQLAIDKSSLSLILSGKRELSKPIRATFFYYFLTYEINKEFRASLI
ncbi:hypothetical protein FNB79_15275 [Formosa sediminum]|uniref:Uncharacterized protein n=1 Tax=Formosa sediminum TaxID=2594004 RepID=A0A516GW94_9FLAO|nr:hypothetical protein FNB79_15275 [Formosa sediminum]